jgi:chromosome segregation ATPase
MLLINLVPPRLAVLTSGTLSQTVADLVESQCAEIREQLNAERMSRKAECTTNMEELMKGKRRLCKMHKEKKNVIEELKATKAKLENTERRCQELETLLSKTSKEIAEKLRK